MSKVLVTGGSGFLAGHCIVQLLAAGHQVRATVRSLSQVPQVRQVLHAGEVLQAGGVEPGRDLAFHAADLSRDEGWADAAAGCDAVLHVASPFPTTQPKNEDDLIVPARDGALRVLKAARDAGVRRVVLTSSFAAVGYGRARRVTPYTEEDWTETDAPNAPYVKSKTIAERAAWDFIAREGGALELCVINPVVIFGPLLGPDFPASLAIVKSMLDGAMIAVPDISFGVVDVRDVADLHLRAMTHPAAKGQRFLAVSGPAVSMRDIARILQGALGPAARRVSTKKAPGWMIRAAALFNRTARMAVPNLGTYRDASSAKAKQMLGWSPRPAEDALVASAESLIRFGLVKE